jgi:suppressor of tumorigenicity protein 13
VSTALMDIMQNPANIAKYTNNPKVTQAMEKMAAKFGASPSMGTFGAEGPGGFPSEGGEDAGVGGVEEEPESAHPAGGAGSGTGAPRSTTHPDLD